MIRSLSLRSRWATASTLASAEPAAAEVRLRALAVALLERLERAPVEREPDEREAVEREPDEREAEARELDARLVLERGVLLARELDDARPLLFAREAPVLLEREAVLLDRDALDLRRLEPPLELEPDPPLLACGICSSFKDDVLDSRAPYFFSGLPVWARWSGWSSG
jgi:hypothetical protein